MNETRASRPFDAQGFLRTLTPRPGVYRMLDANGEVLYVGKARNLKRRLASYFRKSGLPIKTQALMAQMADIEVTVTHTESEALILEHTLIKAHQPRYNVLLRDDKSYPYIYISTDQDYPRITVHRGAKRGKGRYFGPYPNASAVRESLHLLQKVFRVRQCEDSFFANRTRPCLQYQIKRCTAPCVGYISPGDYAEDVDLTIRFLEGKNTELIDELAQRMEAAAEALEYEQAARYRDQIASLRRVQERQYVSGERGDLDIVAAVQQGGLVCVQVFYIRAGRNLGNKVFFPRAPDQAGLDEVLHAFLVQYYLEHEVPQTILLNAEPEDRELIETVLAERAGHRVELRHRVRGERARWLAMAERNAEHALQARLASRSGMQQRMEDLQQLLNLEEPPERIECFDISHTRGEATVASCVVFNAEGPLKSDYRRFNIEGIEPGDDYAAMAQALQRRYLRLQEGEGKLPDILLIDGGKGQVGMAVKVLEELQVQGVLIVGVAKGPERRPGHETLIVPGRGELHPPADSRAFHLIQQVRDEAHRFAITGHRHRRGKARTSSPLEGIPGVGPKRRQQLLRQFGGLREVERAGVEDLARVKGISRELARQIYAAFHGGED
ncbi:excinuclease ABC subunit C [Thiohalobacter thiocyanaticus]|uniref:UvrABC system protein C n=1 Tax=Thiohalobacter thiocyanaticus TaxID=585455 RepID=A0A1Z4VRM1_9GAMM|nr:excinuclease ABC subunit UvrC [Thiohalobacter thiocyanaticus]BAZ94279.1 excinuclease ABC subunit C [Thiohalobacter thiocyanaticus]